tara:strand:+ start:47 stop:937 length:891 start_codon:yes stop_codon:yes gene_type:complete
MRIIFCDSVFDNNIIEPDYEKEKNSALKNGLQFSLISYEELVAGNTSKALKNISKKESEEFGIYRGWMLTPEEYNNLFEGLLTKGIKLINSTSNYKHCHCLPESFHLIKLKTPKSVWTTNLDESNILKLAKEFGQNPIILKDYVKSEKHNWEEACYIENANDKSKVKSTVSKFLELRSNSLNQGIVFRQFEKLQFLTNHSQSGMPLTLEYRLFFLKGSLINIFNYWDEGKYNDELPSLEGFKEVAKTIESNFFTMDIAKKENGEWIIMELGDGQVSGLPDNADTDIFYYNLKENAL